MFFSVLHGLDHVSTQEESQLQAEECRVSRFFCDTEIAPGKEGSRKAVRNIIDTCRQQPALLPTQHKRKKLSTPPTPFTTELSEQLAAPPRMYVAPALATWGL